MTGNTEKFDARSYLTDRFASPNEFRSELYLRGFHGFYQQYHIEWDTKKARVLEFSGGPCIHSLISAAPYVSDILFTDYAEDNLREIKLWRDDDSSSFNWSQFFEFVVKDLEGCSAIDAPLEREKLLRKRIKSIVLCDIKQENPLLVETGDTEPVFDIISCNQTLVTTSVNLDEYKKKLEKLLRLLKPGGFYVGVEALEITWWTVGETKYSTVMFTADGLHDTLRSAGLEILSSSQVEVPESNRFKFSDAKAYIFTVTRKV